VGAPTRHEGPGKPLYNSIRRLFFAEHWKVGTIAAELGLSAYLNEALGRECIPLATLQHDLPAGVAPILSSWLESAEFRRLREELQAIRRSLETYGAGPFVTVDAVTVDAVVQAAGHVLLVQRGRAPGKGLWALPGGFLEPGETLLCGALRGREETKLHIGIGSPVEFRQVPEPTAGGLPSRRC
jgi:hypothetical protein